MTDSSRRPKHSNRSANELWNVSLLPVAAANEIEDSREQLENLADRRSAESFVGPLPIRHMRPNGTLG